MRKRTQHDGITLQAIAGTNVVLLGLDLDPADCPGLLGFAFHRTDHTEDEAYWLEGLKTFVETDPGLPPGAKYSTREHPIQGFTWSDFTAKPGYDYTYRVQALKGTPSNIQIAGEVSLRIQTETPAGGTHDVAFNRGAAASQEYARRFGNRKPDEVGAAAFRWLSRGLYESMVTFIERATGPQHRLRVCAYEFHYPHVLNALAAARARGADVHIVYDRRKDNPGQKNEAAVLAAQLDDISIQRTTNPSAISHNKFIVLVENGNASAVLTGGTNFSESGIFGHSNCVHIVEEPAIADAYLRYWQMLAEDPKSSDLRPTLSDEYVLPAGKPAVGTGVIFSPRRDLAALQWYADRARAAQSGLFMTFAFGIHPWFQDAYRTSTAPMRYALLEKATRPMKHGPEREAEEAKIRALRALPENRFAIGKHFEANKFDHWLGERLSGLNHNVQYVHTKYMLIDPLGADPILISGSANFSEASTNDNDENMLVIRGNERVAHIYLGEFMRLYNHYAFREWAAKQPANTTATPAHLRTDAWWQDYFGDNERSHQRQFFVS